MESQMMNHNTESWAELLPPNLAVLGLNKASEPGAPDLETIWKTPYPVLTRYKLLCKELKIQPFAAGRYQRQGPCTKAGYITSGYRDDIINCRINSPHRFALAIDVIVGPIEKQIAAARHAQAYFPRIGLYPGNSFIHLDLASEAWMKQYRGRRFWVRIQNVYTSFDILEAAIDFIKENLEF